MKKSFLKSAPLNEEMNLQITSMADIFIIILVFLLKSYSSGAMSLAPSQGMSLPSAFSQDAPVEALKVEVSSGAIAVDGNPVVTLKEYRFESSDLQSNGTSSALLKALEFQRQKQLLIAKSNTDVKVDSRIIVLADQKTPYSTVKSVLASAALNGYTDFKLAVVKTE